MHFGMTCASDYLASLRKCVFWLEATCLSALECHIPRNRTYGVILNMFSHRVPCIQNNITICVIFPSFSPFCPCLFVDFWIGRFWLSLSLISWVFSVFGSGFFWYFTFEYNAHAIGYISVCLTGSYRTIHEAYAVSPDLVMYSHTFRVNMANNDTKTYMFWPNHGQTS